MSPAIRPAGNPQGFQSWHTMLFLHWPVPEDALRQLVPAELELDFYDDTAYLSLVLFGMQGVRHRCWPRPLCFQFLDSRPSLAHFVKQVDVEVFKLRPD